MGLVTNSWTSEILIFLLSAVFYLYVRFRRNTAKFWEIRNIPHLPPKFITGNAFSLNIKKSFGETVAEYYRDHKDKKVLGYWLMHQPTLAVFDLDLMQKMLVSDFSYFHDRFPFPGIDDEPLQGHLFNLSGQRWRNLRVKLAPTFTSGKMKMMYPVMVQCGNELQNYLLPTAKNEEVIEIKDILARFTTNIIASCAFGLETNALQNPESEFRIHGKRIFEVSKYEAIINLLGFLFPAFKKLFRLKQTRQDTEDFFINAVADTMEYRKLNNVKRNDFMQLLIQLKEQGKIEDVDKAERDSHEISDEAVDTKFTLNEAAAQAFVFFIAGFETSSTTMTFTFYELAKNQDVQQKLKDEIKSAIQSEGGSLSYEAITKLQYLQMIIDETLRKYPVVPILMRQVTKDYYLPEFDSTLPKGQLLIFPLLGVTRDPNIFEDPEKFDPLRFLPTEVEKRHHFSSIPFGEGPRNCIGNRFGLLQTKVGIVSVLGHYTIKPCEKTPDILKYDPTAFVLTVEGGMHIRLIAD